MRPIVSVRNLSKCYFVGRPRNTSPTLREAIVGAVTAPLAHLRFGLNGVGDPLWALKDVSFEVAPGEVIGIIGSNGAGKSTLLKILSRVVKPTSGEVDIYGRVGSLLQVGTGFHPDLTGRENVFLNGAILGMKAQEIRRNFDEIVAFAEMGKFLETPVKYYSSGMYMRLAFAIAAHLEPEVLLLDEVLAVGDEAFQKKCLAKIKAISRDGRTIFFVSHNLNSIRRLCGRVFLVQSGQLHEAENAETTITNYLTDVAGVEAQRVDVSLGTDQLFS
jgi:lipopolysaccharide transport system ATP-binding protein